MKLKISILDCTLILIYGILFFLTLFDDNMGKWLLLYSICMCVRLMWLHRYNQSILIIIIFATTYFAYMPAYYFFGIRYSTYTNFQTLEYTNGTLRVISLFVLLLFYGIKKKTKEDLPLRECLTCSENRFAFNLCTVVMILICIYAYMGRNIFSYQYGDVTTNSTLFEYYFIFAVIAQCNAISTNKKRILLFINLLYAIATLFLGLRLVTLITIMLLFIFYLEDRYKAIWVVAASIVGFFVMSAFSYIRVGLLHFDWMTLFGIHNGVLINNQGDVFLTSTVHYGITHNGFLSLSDRMESLCAFIINIFLPSSKQLPIGILNQYIKGVYTVGGGGFGAMYAYVWLGYIGVIFLSVFLVHFINSVYESRKSAYYGIFLIITSFRWFAYSLPIVFKMGFYLAIIYFVLWKFKPRLLISD